MVSREVSRASIVELTDNTMKGETERAHTRSVSLSGACGCAELLTRGLHAAHTVEVHGYVDARPTVPRVRGPCLFLPVSPQTACSCLFLALFRLPVCSCLLLHYPLVQHLRCTSPGLILIAGTAHIHRVHLLLAHPWAPELRR